MTPKSAPDLPELKWTKKPVTIEAWQLTEEVALNYWENKILPPFGCKSISGEYNKNTKVVRDAYFFIDTLEGSMKASLGDWIIKGVKGEIYPCKPDIFEATYTRPQSEASALATPVPVGWRPIETAPEGKDILVYCRETGECFVVFWALQMETKQGDWVIARANDGTCFICKNPTHWQPLPAPPQTEERG